MGKSYEAGYLDKKMKAKQKIDYCDDFLMQYGIRALSNEKVTKFYLILDKDLRNEPFKGKRVKLNDIYGAIQYIEKTNDLKVIDNIKKYLENY